MHQPAPALHSPCTVLLRRWNTLTSASGRAVGSGRPRRVEAFQMGGCFCREKTRASHLGLLDSIAARQRQPCHASCYRVRRETECLANPGSLTVSQMPSASASDALGPRRRPRIRAVGLHNYPATGNASPGHLDPTARPRCITPDAPFYWLRPGETGQFTCTPATSRASRA